MENKSNQEFHRIKRPKRRKSKDNPYTLFVQDERFFVSFQDVEGVYRETELTREQYLLFDRFELEDKKEARVTWTISMSTRWASSSRRAS